MCTIYYIHIYLYGFLYNSSFGVHFRMLWREKRTRVSAQRMKTRPVFVSKLQKKPHRPTSTLCDGRSRLFFPFFSCLHRSCLTVILFPTGVSLKRQRERRVSRHRFHLRGEKPLNSCWFFVPESRREDRRRHTLERVLENVWI